MTGKFKSVLCMALCAAITFGPLGTGLAHAQPFPNKPIRLVVPFGTGTGTDAIARVVAAKLSERLGQSVVVDNKPGASGALGADLVTRAPADGYTLLLSSNGTLAAYPELTKTVKYRVERDFTPLAIFTRTPMILITANQPGTPKSVAELLGRLKTSKGSFASNGVGTMGHLATEAFLRAAKQSGGVHVPYKGGGQSYTDLLRGEVLFMSDTPAAAIPFLKSGQMRALAVTGAARLPTLPDVRTFEEQGVSGLGLLYTWWGIFGPPNMPPEIASALGEQMRLAVATQDMKSRLGAMELDTFEIAPGELAGFLRNEVKFWQTFVQQSGITVD